MLLLFETSIFTIFCISKTLTNSMSSKPTIFELLIYGYTNHQFIPKDIINLIRSFYCIHGLGINVFLLCPSKLKLYNLANPTQQYSINFHQNHTVDRYFHSNVDYTYNHTSLPAYIQQNSIHRSKNIKQLFQIISKHVWKSFFKF